LSVQRENPEEIDINRFTLVHHTIQTDVTTLPYEMQNFLQDRSYMISAKIRQLSKIASCDVVQKLESQTTLQAIHFTGEVDKSKSAYVKFLQDFVY